MTRESLGNQLDIAINSARGLMFQCAEQAQLTFLAFELAAQELMSPDGPESKTISFPLGLHPDKTTIPGERTYSRSDLLTQYQLLAVRQLSINGLSQLVSVVEAMLEDIIRFVIVRHPKKLGSKKQISLQAVLESTTLEDVHSRAIDALLNELAYEAPSEFAKAFESFVGVKLLESPAFHRYIELKASRDVFIHNRGVANATYKRKSGSHARVIAGENLPCDTRYFLESYEACLQLSEWLETELHEIWPSSEFERRKTAQYEMQLPQAKANHQ